MRLNDTVDLYKVEKVSDGRGGFRKFEQYKYSVDCKIKRTRLNRQEQLYGEIMQGAISIITLEEIDEECIIFHDNKKYEISNFVEAFKKYCYDLTEIAND